MTISTDTARTGPYTGNGATTVFAYTFKVIDEAHLVVTLTTTATGVEVVQTLTTHYTVSGVGAEGGGNVTMVTFPATTETLTITRAVTKSQTTDLVNRGAVQPEVLETALDRGVQMTQDLDEVVDRSVRFAVSADLSSFDPDVPEPVASKAIAINAAATAFVLVDLPLTPADGSVTYAKFATGVVDTDISAVSGSDDTIASAKSIKTYVDAQVTAQDFDFAGDSGTGSTDLNSQTSTFAGGTGITTSAGTQILTVGIDSTVATLAGSQTLTNKSLTSPTVTGASQVNATVTVGVDDTGYDVKFFGATSGAYMLWDESVDDLVLAGAGIDVDGTTNLNVVDIDGAVQIDNTVTVGLNDTGYDVKFFGATAGSYMLWDESVDDLVLAGAGIDVDGTTNLNVVDIDGAVQIDNTVTVGVNDTGYDFKLFGATSGAYMLWDESADDLKLVGAAGLTVAGVTTHGDDVVSDTDSTDDLGTTGVRWANLFVDGITATDQITATGFTGTTLDGILGSGSAAAATVTTLTGTTITASTAFVPDASDGAALGTTALEFSDLFLADGAVISFGDDDDVTLTHVHDIGLNLKHAATADDKPIILTLQTGETDMAANDVIGKIAFQAPDEGTGTDAILVSGAIQARAEGDFSASNNATSLDFMTGASEAAATKMTLSSAGRLGIGATTVDADLHIETAAPTIKLEDSDNALSCYINGDNGNALIQSHNVNRDIIFGENAASGELMRVKGTGEVTKPLQPAFLCYNSATDSNVTGNGTLATIDYDTEVFDQGGDFTADTFTAPVSGRYLLSFGIEMDQLTSSATLVQADLVTSNRTIRQRDNSTVGGGLHCVTGSWVCDMDASDTAKIQLTVTGEGSDVIDIVGYGSTATFFSGCLLA